MKAFIIRTILSHFKKKKRISFQKKEKLNQLMIIEFANQLFV